MSIAQAGLKSSVFEAASEYLNSGVSIIPLRGKLSALKSWAPAQQYRASQKVLNQWQTAGLLENVGIVCGAVSGNLVVLDFDSHEAVNDFELTFSDFTDTYVVSSGSRRGAHYYFYTKVLPASIMVKNYELRANGHYVVAPPSIHPTSGLQYEVQRRANPMSLYCMDEIVSWVKSKRPHNPPAAPQAKNLVSAPRLHNMSREEYFRRRYIESALTRQLRYLASATEGTRNKTLYMSALILGQLVAGGELNRFSLTEELLSAARRLGLTDNEAIKTIDSGLKAGENNPRRCPPAPAPRGH